MRFGWVLAFAILLAASSACSAASFATSDEGGVGADATDENPAIFVDGSAGHDGAGADASTHDAAGHDGAPVDATSSDAAGGDATGDSAGDAAGEAGATDTGPPSCATGLLDCGGTCVPSDVHDCGSCGHDCTNLAHVAGATSCTPAGACAFPAASCAPGWGDCNGNPDDGCETDITQPGHCGACTTSCSSTLPVCAGSGGSYGCVSGCQAPTPTLCTGTCVDTTSDPKNCKTCGDACPGITNGQPACTASVCGFKCNSGYSGCPTASPTACVDEAHDPGNCGACAHVCPGTTNGQPACSPSGCTVACNPGYTGCPTANPTACDDTTKDVANCGGCGNVCSTTVTGAHPTCSGSQCGAACDVAGDVVCPAMNACIVGAPDGANGVFVSLVGSATGCGTATNPCNNIGYAAMFAQASGRTIVYVDRGYYGQGLGLNPGITIQGGWTYDSVAGTWTHDCPIDPGTVIIDATSDRTVSAGGGALDSLTIENNRTASTGGTSYGLFASAGTVTLTNVHIVVSGGGKGAAGSQGSAGPAAPTTCTADSTSSAGTAGANGTPANAGFPGTYSATGFAPSNMSPGGGTPGTQGYNGSPGGGPNCKTGCCDTGDGTCGACSPSCSGPGSPGCGGYGSGTGYPGGGGGASIGVFAGNATVILSGVSIQTGAGGNGGNGGPGGTPAQGSAGAVGTAVIYDTSCQTLPAGCQPGGNCTCSIKATAPIAGGAAGGAGGAGGTGGQGGGGAGGDSFCYATGGTGQVTGTPSCTAGQPGAGGNQGLVNQGPAGKSGLHN